MNHITKRFVGTVALKDVSISLNAGEVLAILGENGAGKSTLMKILSGIYPANSYEGEILVNGQPCSFYSTKDAERCGIAIIPQEINLSLDLSIVENIVAGMIPTTKLGLVDWKTARAQVSEILETLNVRLDVNMAVRRLNASMQQIICIARALYRKPKILILDEPTSCLTESETRDLFTAVEGLKAQGIACLYISHKLDEVFRLCDRVIVLRDGLYISQYVKEEYNSAVIIGDIVGRSLDSALVLPEKTIGEEVLRLEHFQVPHPFTYGASIIEDVSLDLHKGEIVGLCGLVGSGRSELLNSVFGVIPKTRGELFIRGEKVQIKNPRDAKKYGIGLLTEDRKKNGYIGCMSIRQNMTITILDRIKGKLLINRKKETAIVREYYDRMKVKAPGLDTNILSLSGGNQQKVLVAKWLATQADILFFDEPTRGIDVGTKRELYMLFGELAAQGVSIIVVSSEMKELIGICDRFVVLSKGRVRTVLGKDEADEARILHECSGLDA